MGGKSDDMDWLDDAIEGAIDPLNKQFKLRPDSKSKLTIEVESEWIIEELGDESDSSEPEESS